MKRSTLTSFATGLSFLGLFDAWYLADAALTKTPLTCDIAGITGCNVVAQSAFSHVLGVPLGLYGVGFYAVAFVLSIFLVKAPSQWTERALVVWAGLGTIASVYFIYVQAVLIQALCIYCLVSAGITVFLLLISFAILRKAPPSSP